MDALDRAILSQLQADGRRSFTSIAQEMGVTEGTVRNRVGRLQHERVLQIVGLIDPHRVGYEAPALVAVNIAPNHIEAAAAQIAEMPEVSYLVLISGEFDLLVEVLCRDREHLTGFLTNDLQGIEGVLRTQTSMILHTYKMAHGAQPALHENTAAGEAT